MTKQQIKIVTLGGLIGVILMFFFGFSAIMMLIQGLIGAMFGMAFLSYVWSPYFDRHMKEEKIRITWWAKFAAMWIVLAILSYGGFYE